MTMQSVARVAFAVGTLPLLGLAFRSPGLQPEHTLGFVIFGFGLLTLLLLIMSPHRRWSDKVLIALQLVLLGLVVYETLSGSRFYGGQ